MKQNQLLLASLILLTACGGGGGSSESTAVTTPTNNPPSASNDTFAVGMNAATELDVLSNDTDSDAFSITAMTEPTNGSLVNNSSTITYTANDGYVGSDTFSYTITDTAGQESSAVVTLSIANLPPVAENDAAQTMQSQAVLIDILSNDISGGGHSLTIASTSSPAHGSTSHDGEFLTYTPANGFVGSDSFVYVVRDSYGDETTASVGVTIENVKPEAVDDTSSFAQNSSVTIDVLANDIDAAGEVLELVSIDVAENGEAAIDNNQVVFTPTNGFAGTETLNYTVIDAYGASSQASLTLDITNTTPTANDDNDDVLRNYSITIDVLANDSDAVGDDLSIQSVSAPQNGSASIVDGKVVYQPTTDYVGDDSFGYTAIDSYGASDSGFISVTVHNAIQLQGKIVGYEQAGLTVTLNAGGNETQATTDENGEFIVEVDVSDEDVLAIATVENAATNYTMYAYLGDVASLLTAMDDETFVVANQNITDLTTAEYELIDVLREGSEASNLTELSESQYFTSSTLQLEMLIASQLINQDNGISLPDSFTTVNELLRSSDDLRSQMAGWRDNNSSLYHQAFTDFSINSDLVSYPERATEGGHLLYESHTGTTYLSLSDDNSGTYLSVNDEQFAMSWQKNTSSLVINLNEVAENSDNRLITYCSDGSGHYSGYDLQDFELTLMYSTPTFDVYLQKASINELEYGCMEGETKFYNTIKHFKYTSFNLAADNILVNKLAIKNENTDEKTVDYDIADLTFGNDGTFIDNGDTTNPLTGLWSNINDTLRLDYDEGYSLIYNMFINYNNASYLHMYYVKDGQILGTARSLIIEPEETINWSYDTGYVWFNWMPVWEEYTNTYRYVLNNDYTGEHQHVDDGIWTEYSSNYGAHFTWRIEGNRYYLDYYRQDYDYVNYCDVTLEGCYIYTQREFEVIKQDNGINYVKYAYKSFDESGEMTNNSNSLTILNFTED